MSAIKDINLAKSGWDKINWVKSYMPILNSINKRFSEEKPFAGKKISMSIHLEAKTAYLALTLAAGGAEVYVTGCNPLSTQDDVAAALVDAGFEVNAWRGVTDEEYEEHLKKTLSLCPDVMIDDGGDLTHLLHGECREYGKNLIGGCEETTTGVHRLMSREAQGKLDYTMIDVNDANCKHLFDNRYGTGQSTLDGIMNSTNLMIAGKTFVIAGYGWCGKGVALRAKGMGAKVIVTETDPVKALEAVMDGYEVMPMAEAAKLGDMFITVTGCADVISTEHMLMMKEGAILCNAGHFDCEVDVAKLRELAVESVERRANIIGYRMADGRTLNVLAEGRLVNLASGNGHPAEIMDMSFSVQAMASEWLAKNKDSLELKMYDIPAEIDDQIGRVKLAAMGYAIDTLTEEQQAYLAGWEA